MYLHVLVPMRKCSGKAIIQLPFRLIEFGIAITEILNHIVKTKAVKSTYLSESTTE